ncbi:hypothetical protein EGW08_019012 [Elysia chlorotica]|uniref:EF-hand domain-containing protein n=1 Tax=Elysia chlorotica TaxID=188477 RepID=A0A3S1AVE4_ELYCH|nr:hypothetical protein EGW08_019012 [Elysia chlorotica]
MAQFFSESEIDGFKECFFFHARKGIIKSEGELSIVIRSLNFCVTKDEVKSYFDKYVAGDGSIDFASFLNVMHEHSQVEDKQKELKAALVAHDTKKQGFVDASELKHILTSIGEKLTSREVETLLREAGMPSSGPINISKFVETVMTPQPDY